jgi:hypothetical protein
VVAATVIEKEKEDYDVEESGFKVKKKELLNKLQRIILDRIDEKKREAVDNWLIEQITDKIKKTYIISSRTSKPFVLFRNTLEESGTSAQEEVTIMNGKYIIILHMEAISHQAFKKYKFSPWKNSRNG